MLTIKNQIDKTKIPHHVAIIMDGNGRWAKTRGENRLEGHNEGANSLSAVTEAAAQIGVKHLTVYAISTENWNRPQEDVEALMSLLLFSIENRTKELLKNNIRLLVIGDIQKLPNTVKERLQDCINQTAHCSHMDLNFGAKLFFAMGIYRQ
jgi:undecaprenyl diphosphate synthase